MSFIPKANDKQLFDNILKAMNRQVNEEIDPHDSGTKQMFSVQGHAFNDDPDFHTVHHAVELHVTKGNRRIAQHEIGSKTYKREPHETADAFDNRVANEIGKGHGSYDEMTDEHHEHYALGPVLHDGIRAAIRDYGTEPNGWLMAAVGPTNDHYMHGDKDKTLDNRSLNTQIVHHIKLGK